METYDREFATHNMNEWAILLSPRIGDATSCIRHLVSDKLLSLMSNVKRHSVA